MDITIPPCPHLEYWGNSIVCQRSPAGATQVGYLENSPIWTRILITDTMLKLGRCTCYDIALQYQSSGDGYLKYRRWNVRFQQRLLQLYRLSFFFSPSYTFWHLIIAVGNEKGFCHTFLVPQNSFCIAISPNRFTATKTTSLLTHVTAQSDSDRHMTSRDRQFNCVTIQLPHHPRP